MPTDEELNEWKGAYECYDKDKDGKDKGEFVHLAPTLTTSPSRQENAGRLSIVPPHGIPDTHSRTYTFEYRP